VTIADGPPRRRLALDARHVVIAAYVALAAKLLLALVTAGTNDVGAFLRFGETIRAHGLGAMYRTDPDFNHSPLIALLTVVLAPLQSFPFWIRLPGILADLVTVKVLIGLNEAHRLVPWWALTLFAASPVSLLIAGYHGNVDPVMVMALVLATAAVTHDRPVATALWLALAVNIKIAAALVVPVFALLWWHRGRGRSFGAVFAVTAGGGWLPALLVARHEVTHQVFGYTSRWGTWGLSFLLRRFGGASFQPAADIQTLTHAESLIVAVSKALIVAATLALAWRGRAAGPREVWVTLARTWLVFFALAPGAAPQYLVWLAPFLLVASTAEYVGVTAASAVSLVTIYGITSQWRFEFSYFSDIAERHWIPWALPAWLAILAVALVELRAGLTRRRAARR
jgi:hypothetical protein